MKNFLLGTVKNLIGIVLVAFFFIGETAWVWSPIVFGLFTECDGLLVLVISIVISFLFRVVEQKFFGEE